MTSPLPDAALIVNTQSVHALRGHLGNVKTLSELHLLPLVSSTTFSAATHVVISAENEREVTICGGQIGETEDVAVQVIGPDSLRD